MDDDLQADMYEWARHFLKDAGYPQYEISNFSRPGRECRHNLIYWRYGEYAGVGPGAHGRLLVEQGRRAQANERHPEMWLTTVESEGNGLIEDQALSREEQGDEYLLMGLRLNEGVDLTALSARFGLPQDRLIHADKARFYGDLGLIDRTDHRLTVTPQGMPLLDGLLGELVAA